MGGWQQLIDIARDAITELNDELASKRIDCPHDGFLLVENSSGEQRCPFCGWPDYV